MDEHSQGARAGGPSHRAVELGVAVFVAAFALIVIAGSLRAGVGWGAEGPRPGFFPFYVALVILGASIVNFGAVISRPPNHQLFADWGQLRQVMAMLVPTAIYVRWCRGLASMSRPYSSLPCLCDGLANTDGGGSPRSRWVCRS